MDPGATRAEDGPSLSNGRDSPDTAPAPPEASPDIDAPPGSGGVNAVDAMGGTEGTEGPEGPEVFDAPDGIEEFTSLRARR